MDELKLSHEQARNIAAAIAVDIQGYIATHRAEYAEFVRAEQLRLQASK